MKEHKIKELSIQVNLNGLSFCILNKTSNTVEYLKQIVFNSKLTPFDALHRLKTELSANTVFSDEFKSVNVVHQNELSSLVPNELYDESVKADYLKFNAKILKTDFITHDDVEKLNSVNVYIPYVNINNYIFDTFGEFIYKHSSTLLIDSILKNSKAEVGAKVHINVNRNTLEVLVVDNKKLQLYNSFEYHSKEDFIYYVLFVFEQLKLDVETVSVTLSGAIDKDDENYNILYTYIRHIEILDFYYRYRFSDAINKEELHKYFIILNSF